MKKFVTATIFKKRYADVFKGDTNWRKIKTVESETYRWNMNRNEPIPVRSRLVV